MWIRRRPVQIIWMSATSEFGVEHCPEQLRSLVLGKLMFLAVQYIDLINIIWEGFYSTTVILIIRSVLANMQL